MRYCKTASDIREEGKDDVKSSWPLWVGLHMCYTGDYNAKRYGNMELHVKGRRVRIALCNSRA